MLWQSESSRRLGPRQRTVTCEGGRIDIERRRLAITDAREPTSVRESENNQQEQATIRDEENDEGDKNRKTAFLWTSREEGAASGGGGGQDTTTNDHTEPVLATRYATLCNTAHCRKLKLKLKPKPKLKRGKRLHCDKTEGGAEEV